MNWTLTSLCIASTLLATLAGSGCSTPSLSPICDAGSSIRHEDLVGEWKSDSHRARVIAQGDKPVYKLVISAIDGDEIKGSLNLELRATKIGENRYLDLFLAASERRKLVDQYGGLAIPTHQIMRYALEGDTLTVWMLKEGGLPGTDGRTRIVYTEDDTEVITADTPGIRRMVESAPRDAFDSATKFTRVR